MAREGSRTRFVRKAALLGGAVALALALLLMSRILPYESAPVVLGTLLVCPFVGAWGLAVGNAETGRLNGPLPVAVVTALLVAVNALIYAVIGLVVHVVTGLFRRARDPRNL